MTYIPLIRSWLSRLALCGGLLLPIAAAAQPPAAPSQAAEQPGDPRQSAARAAVEGATVDAPPATLTFQNRPITELRATVLSRTPAMRAQAAERFLSDLVDRPPSGPARARPLAGAVMIAVGDTDVFALVPADADPLGGRTLDETAANAVAALQVALDETTELRNPRRILTGAGLALAATVALGLLLFGLIRGRRVLAARLAQAADRQLKRLPGSELLDEWHFPARLSYLVTFLTVAVALFLFYSWLTFVLRRFPYTRPWGEALRGFLADRLAAFGVGLLSAIPDLFTVLLIVVFTRFLSRLVGLVFDAVAEGRLNVPWVHPDTAQTTRRLAIAVLWLFALAMAYPYLPGSDTDAFKGVSVFIGVIVSLGSSGIVNQVMSGLTLTYSRAVQSGDYVRIENIEGTVTDMGMLATKLRTPRREELTIPNAVMVSTVTTNYTRLHRSDGVFVPTSVTIGYDSPWRQVQALLLLAAERTTGIRQTPAPRVLQAGLRDSYVEYTLLVSLEDPALKGPVLDELHGHIQDAFNEFGVQIMSPNYEGDPEGRKVVPRDQWFAAPAPSPSSDSQRARR